MREKKLYYFLIIFIVACSKTDVPKNEENKVTIIINNKNQIKTNIGSGINIKTFNQLDYHTVNKNDTLQLNSNDYLKLYIKNNESFISILCQKSDTLFLNIDYNKINYSFSNRLKKKYDTILISQKISKNQKKERNTLKNKFFITDSITGKKKHISSFSKENIKDFRKLYTIEQNLIDKKINLLDAIYSKNQISEANYEYEKSKINYQHFNLLINKYLASKDDYYYSQLKSKYIDKNLMIDDSFISYGYLNGFISNIVLNKEKKRKGTRIFKDYKKAFDSLPNYLSGETLKYAQFLCLNKLAENSSDSIFNNALNTFKTNHNDTTLNKNLIHILDNKYKITTLGDLKKDTETTNLIDFNDNKFTLDQIIKNNKGYIIYLDFWASWCIPCRKEMPQSHKLSKEFSKHKIKFFYISIDKNNENWKKASLKEKLIAKNNFWAVNYANSTFYKSLKIQTIPRYIIINKRGKIVNSNAPRPSNEKLKSLFLKYLSE